YDSAIPSGNSISTRNLILLSELTKDPKYRQYAIQTLQLFGRIIKRYPERCAQMVQAVGESLESPVEGKQSAISIPAGDFTLVQSDPLKSVESDEQLVAVNPGVELLLAAGLGQTSKKKKLVSAKAYLSVDKLPAGKTCQVAIVLSIEKGWHINSNPASIDFLVPTTFTIKSIQNVKLSNIKYPAGHAFEVAGFDQPIQVYEKQAIVRGILTIPANSAGNAELLELNVKYQACNDKTCIRPTTVSLKGKFRVAKPGEPIKQINQQWFKQK
ncbi:MAG: protein-disulfide reductase DsbD family protein, partial [Gimesia sp.]